MFFPLVLLATELTTLNEGMALIVRLERSISSEKVQFRDAVPLTVVHALKVDGCTVIEQDAAVQGRIILAQRNTHFGRNGLLDIAAERVQAIDGEWVRLRHAPVKTADPEIAKMSRIRTTAGLIWYGPTAPIIRMLAKGKEVWIPKSARFTVYTDEPRRVRARCESP